MKFYGKIEYFTVGKLQVDAFSNINLNMTRTRNRRQIIFQWAYLEHENVCSQCEYLNTDRLQ